MGVNAFGWAYPAEYAPTSGPIPGPPTRVPLNMPALIYMRKREGKVRL